ncbi:MAG: hypothetical protein U5R31_08660 [Acidimicrobiia bacterium]|nr:hypothetical protein [Acidimicrobiia bacterium]
MAIDVAALAPPAAVLKALAERTRWQIVELLSGEELCVCATSPTTSIWPQPLVSRR